MVDPRKVRALLGRNPLVHEYAQVDDRRVHAFLRDGLDDLRGFGAAIYEAFNEL